MWNVFSVYTVLLLIVLHLSGCATPATLHECGRICSRDGNMIKYQDDDVLCECDQGELD